MPKLKKPAATLVPVLYLMAPQHRDRLQAAAMERRAARGGTGRLDSSEVLRALLDDWIDSGAALPERLTKGKR